MRAAEALARLQSSQSVALIDGGSYSAIFFAGATMLASFVRLAVTCSTAISLGVLPGNVVPACDLLNSLACMTGCKHAAAMQDLNNSCLQVLCNAVSEVVWWNSDQLCKAGRTPRV